LEGHAFTLPARHNPQFKIFISIAVFGVFLAIAFCFPNSIYHCAKIHNMINLSAQQQTLLKTKAAELGIAEYIMACALDIIAQNRNLVNAMDNSSEMDEYIYKNILKHSFEKRRERAEADLYSADESVQAEARKDLSILSREELGTDPFYRAVLPLVVKVLVNEPVLRLHAEEASAIVLELADFKRRHRATSLTEIIVKRCSEEIQAFHAA
jgi:hypothetical protein